MEGMAFLPPSAARNRLCVVISDIHCTDGTVGNQSAEEPDWEQFFDELSRACFIDPEHRRIDELVLILNGDIVDLIRTAKWTQAGVYPWQHTHRQFAPLINEILDDIIRIHASDGGMAGRHGFFWWLKHLKQILEPATRVLLIPIVGNHDKELQLVAPARLRFYRDCLGIAPGDFCAEYLDWIEAMYGAQPDNPRAAENPWLPFYYGDRGFRLFATHGQWRDKANSRHDRHWCVRHGWRPDVWRHHGYANFTQPCFGDTVAAGLLSAFIWRTKQDLRGQSEVEKRLKRILDEMDLYRPSVAAIVRLLHESQQLARRGEHDVITDMISGHFRDCLLAWLRQRMTWKAAPWPIMLFLPLLHLLACIHSERISLKVMKLMAQLQAPKGEISTEQLLKLTGFLPAYRQYGFRIHTEGHTHVALEAEL